MMDDDKIKPVDSGEETTEPTPQRPNIDVQINTFGNTILNVDVDTINEYLNHHLDDKKLNNDKD